MGKKSTASLARGPRVKRNAKHIPDSQIDFSDIPELTDSQLKEMKRLGRPLLGSFQRQMIAIRIDPVVLKKLKKYAERKGKGYQTLINEILHRFVKNEAA